MVPDNQSPLPLDRPEQHQVRYYTGSWSTRALGTVPQVGDSNAVIVQQKHWEPKNTYENMCWALFIALFELCCALAFTCLGIYHWATTTAQKDKPYNFPESAQLTMAGLAATWVAAMAVVAFYPDKRGRLTKRLVVIFSLPTLIMLVNSISLISNRIAPDAYDNKPVDGFYIAEVILVSLLLAFIVTTLYPASEACIPHELQRSSAIRAVVLSANTVVGAIVLIYFCFAIYGVHAAFDPRPDFLQFKLGMSTTALPTTSLLLLVSLGAYSAVGRGIRSHMIPYIVVGIAALFIFLDYTQKYVSWLDYFMAKDWRDNAFVAMFALNCLSIAGVAITVSLSIAFIVL
jgi:hypothetical protein